ncbi:MAG TPA: YjgP/YjgQ family permease [Thermodesulfobacteriaceae bacterium]|nr:YjgP/YjgQ family permease [Thermodesulfobacteriaceae bacterium]
MRLYQRYLLSPLKLFIPLFVLALSGLYLLVEFFERLEDVLSEKVPFHYFWVYLVLKIPEIFFQIWPSAMAFAALTALAYLSRGQELLALRSLGFSHRKLIVPYLAVAFFLSLGASVFLALTLPRSAYQALYTWEVRIKGQRPQSLLAEGKLFLTGRDFILSAKPLEPGGEWLAEFFFVEHRDLLPVRILYARRARFLGEKRWLLEHGVVETKIRNFQPQIFDRQEFDIPFSPAVMLSVKRPLKALALRELFGRYRFLKDSGLSAAEPFSEILFRLIYPFLAPVMLFPALTAFLSFRGKRASAKGLSAGLFIIVASYALIFSAKILSAGGYISPYLALPLSLILPTLLAIILLRRYSY